MKVKEKEGEKRGEGGISYVFSLDLFLEWLLFKENYLGGMSNCSTCDGGFMSIYNCQNSSDC